MLSRFVIKIAGESGTGIESSGVIVMKALKKMGYWLTADREFPSLIKGGSANYQINFSDKPVRAMSTQHDVGLAVDREGIKSCLNTLKPGGLLIHGFEKWPRALRNLEKDAAEKKLELIYIPATTIAKDNGGSNLMVNVVILGTLWKVLGFDLEILAEQVKKQFGKKLQLLDINLRCLESGYNFITGAEQFDLTTLKNLQPKPENNGKNLLIDGNTALTMGAIHAGVRVYYAYPMSPASSILTYFAKSAFKTGIVVKQAEDEITAAQLTLGSMHVGVRSFTATSGGGFDLMTETISLSGMIETPLVVVVAQRPGPATGLPTWTAQGDLNLVINGGHGEYGRIVLACNDPQTAFENIQHAFNLAEKFQCPTVMLTEKTIGESKTIVSDFEQNTIPIERGLVKEEKLPELKPEDRYEITDSGVSKRWLPGFSETTYFANGDEHHEDGTLDETEGTKDMIAKRLRKLDTIRKHLPDPEIFGSASGADISFIGWGSSKNAVLDAMEVIQNGEWGMGNGELETKSNSPLLRGVSPSGDGGLMAQTDKIPPSPQQATLSAFGPPGNPERGGENSNSTEHSKLPKNSPLSTSSLGGGGPEDRRMSGQQTNTENNISTPPKINYLHFTYLWPLKTEKLEEFFANNPNVYLIEGNATGQLGELIAQQTGLRPKDLLLKFNGRPFYVEDILKFVQKIDIR